MNPRTTKVKPVTEVWAPVGPQRMQDQKEAKLESSHLDGGGEKWVCSYSGRRVGAHPLALRAEANL